MIALCNHEEKSKPRLNKTTWWRRWTAAGMSHFISVEKVAIQ